MIRTQIYITENERRSLAQLARHTGKNQSELIREAIDLFCQLQAGDNRVDFLRSAKGIWEDRNDLSDFESIRKEFDREFAKGK